MLRVSGEVDLGSLRTLEAALDASLDQRPDHLLVDLGGLSFCCVRGMALLLTGARRATSENVDFAVSGVPSRIGRIWHLLWDEELPRRHTSTVAAVLAIQAQQVTGPDVRTVREAPETAS